MKSWTYVYFTSTLPDNTRWDETVSEMIEPGGKVPLKKIADHMRSDGYKIDGIHQRSHYGWEFDARSSSQRFHVVIQYANFDSHVENCWLLQICPPAKLFRPNRRSPETEAAILQVKARLLADDNFANILWMNYDEHEAYCEKLRAEFQAAARARQENEGLS